MPTVFEALDIAMTSLSRLATFIFLSVLYLTYLLFMIVRMLQDLQAEIHLLYRGMGKCFGNVSDVAPDVDGGLYG